MYYPIRRGGFAATQVTSCVADTAKAQSRKVPKFESVTIIDSYGLCHGAPRREPSRRSMSHAHTHECRGQVAQRG